jgi:hypothetical protein
MNGEKGSNTPHYKVSGKSAQPFSGTDKRKQIWRINMCSKSQLGATE